MLHIYIYIYIYIYDISSLRVNTVCCQTKYHRIEHLVSCVYFFCTLKCFALNRCYLMYSLQWRSRHFFSGMCVSLSSDLPTPMCSEENNVFYRNWSKCSLNLTARLYSLPRIRLHRAFTHPYVFMTLCFRQRQTFLRRKVLRKCDEGRLLWARVWNFKLHKTFF